MSSKDIKFRLKFEISSFAHKNKFIEFRNKIFMESVNKLGLIFILSDIFVINNEFISFFE